VPRDICDDEVGESRPALEARLEDGSRVAAMMRPCSVDGPTLTIRKFTARLTLLDLVARGCLPMEVAIDLQRAIELQKNILISGGTGTGKTTLLNALASLIPDGDRIVLIEDTSEIKIDNPNRNLVRFEARKAQEGDPPIPAITIAHLLRDTLRHRPDRILVGEVRGPEAYDLLQAMNTGHEGTISTIHANRAEQAVNRLANCVQQAQLGLSLESIYAQIAMAIHVVVHIARDRRRLASGALVDGGRRVTQVLEVAHYQDGAFAWNRLYERPVDTEGALT
jgi:pilus assembly protein CpaF